MLLETPKEMAWQTAQREKAFRKRQKMTLKELSERTGIPYSTLRRFESTGEIAFVSLVKIASVLGEEEAVRALFGKPRPQTIEEVIRENRR